LMTRSSMRLGLVDACLSLAGSDGLSESAIGAGVAPQATRAAARCVNHASLPAANAPHSSAHKRSNVINAHTASACCVTRTVRSAVQRLQRVRGRLLEAAPVPVASVLQLKLPLQGSVLPCNVAKKSDAQHTHATRKRSARWCTARTPTPCAILPRARPNVGKQT
jgi:hypothetical protein